MFYINNDDCDCSCLGIVQVLKMFNFNMLS